MSTMEDRLMKMREERAAREKARIEKLRELNLKKYIKNEAQGSLPNKQTHKLVKSNSVSQIKNNNAPVKNNFHVNGTTKRPVTAPTLKKPKEFNAKTSKADTKEAKTNYLQKNIAALKNIDKPSVKSFESAKGQKLVARNENRDPNINDNTKKTVNTENIEKRPTLTNKINNDKLFDRKSVFKSDKVLAEIKPFKKIDPKLSRKSIAAFQKPTNLPAPSRKSMIPKIDCSKESVFDRLYKPKFTQKKTVDDVAKLQTDPNYLKKVIKSSGLILKRHTCFDTKEVSEPVRRSISAVHFKRIGKNELGNCIHKWASIGDKLNLAIDEGDSIKEDKVVSAVKSERKKVKFMTSMSRFATPRPEELQARLRTWLQKRGKSLDAYQHLQCFGIHHLPHSMKPLNLEATPTPKTEHYEEQEKVKTDLYDEENKENIAVDSDSDDGSYSDNMIDQKVAASPKIDIDKWRQTSLASESMHTEFNETADLNETTVTSADTYVNLDDLVTGALNDLAELLKEGFDWEQSARYLRAIRSRFPEAPRTAAYWECRAALEERRGDLHASVQCWEEAIAKGTERNVVESNLDTLLNKFMQLKISPRAPAKRVDPKMVDVKNVFKSTIIRFAVQQAKLSFLMSTVRDHASTRVRRELVADGAHEEGPLNGQRNVSSRQSEAPVFTVTPVRRSGRLSLCPTPRGATPHGNTPRGATPHGNTPREPLRLCDSVKQVREFAPQHFFTPNENLVRTP